MDIGWGRRCGSGMSHEGKKGNFKHGYMLLMSLYKSIHLTATTSDCTQ